MRAHFSQNVVGYIVLAIAIIVASVVFQTQQNRQDRLGAELSAQQRRSCAAIGGAVEFWRLSLAATNLALKDDSLSAVGREARLRQKAALTNVIDQAARVAEGC